MEAYIKIPIFIPSFRKTKEVKSSGVMRKKDLCVKWSKFLISDTLFLHQNMDD